MLNVRSKYTPYVTYEVVNSEQDATMNDLHKHATARVPRTKKNEKKQKRKDTGPRFRNAVIVQVPGTCISAQGSPII